MSALTDAQDRLALYLTAEASILNSQSYSIGGRSLTRANLAEVRDQIKDLKAEVANLTNGGMKQYRMVPRFN